MVNHYDRKQIIQDYHREAFYPGIKRTVKIITEHFYWVGIEFLPPFYTKIIIKII